MQNRTVRQKNTARTTAYLTQADMAALRREAAARGISVAALAAHWVRLGAAEDRRKGA